MQSQRDRFFFLEIRDDKVQLFIATERAAFLSLSRSRSLFLEFFFRSFFLKSVLATDAVCVKSGQLDMSVCELSTCMPGSQLYHATMWSATVSPHTQYRSFLQRNTDVLQKSRLMLFTSFIFLHPCSQNMSEY